uniref:DUF4831 family protein n=1 Tax=Alistipes sp. TaxID=1872444 RepID=UPI0040567A86
MKRLGLILLLLGGAFSLSAQEGYIQVEGLVEGADGPRYHLPQTTLAVDLTLSCEEVVAGPYARYALKYLGVRAPFSDKSTYKLLEAHTARYEPALPMAAEPAAPQTVEEEYMHPERGFALLAVDRLELNAPAQEEAARQAAARIFSLRRSRLDLITGEAGEHVFGEGLQAALDAIEEQEQALLELFLGRHTTTTTTHRFELTPTADKRQYILCRFSEQDGLLAADDLSGEIVLLEIQPGEPYAVEEAQPKVESVVCRVAAPSTCIVQSAGKELSREVLPIYAYGRTVRVAVPRKK